MTVLLLHTAAVAALAGTSWVVQLAVYPAFATIGPSAAWDEHHRRHSTAMTRLVLLPWAVQGATLAVLLLAPPTGVSLWLLGLASALGLGTVVVTAAWSLPCHARLATAYDGVVLASLLRSNLWRALLWSAGTACALAMAWQASS